MIHTPTFNSIEDHFSMTGSQALVLWRGINDSISIIIGLKTMLWVLGCQSALTRCPFRNRSMALKTICFITVVDIYLESFKTQTLTTSPERRGSPCYHNT